MKLGPFELFRPFASGGMSDIWSAWHIPSGVFAAVKLIPPTRVDPDSRLALEREIRTAASLDHPGIVWVFDQGTINDEIAALSDGQILEGSPYLVMEYASYTLRDLLPIDSWGELRGILVSLLDALAYAHARGVIHRDLKPGNVLICGADDQRPGLKLTDFGIAHALDASDPVTGTRKIVGTPRYMAPEQVDGDWRSLGPGTDLYALGCLIFRCITGHGPFQSTGSRLLLDHLRAPAPALPLPDGFPAEFEGWVAWLLEKDIAHRPSSAAAALRALPPGFNLPITVGEAVDEEETLPLITTPMITLGPSLRARMSPSNVQKGTRLLPFPPQWRRPHTVHPRLQDVGRAMLGLRPIPIAGRVRCRDMIWTAARQSANRKEAIAMSIIGQKGLGRSRMLTWAERRVRELACGFVLSARCLPRGDLGQTLQRQLERYFHVKKLDPAAATNRLAEAHRQLGIPLLPQIEPALRTGADTDVIVAATVQFIEQLAQVGPVLVTIDDVHNLPEILGPIRKLLALPAPITVLLTTSTEAIATAPELGRALNQLCSVHHALQPLRAKARAALINSMLPLSPGLSAALQEHTAGNPRFTVQLLSDWVQRGVLTPSEKGFEAPRDFALPMSLKAIWSGRIRHLLSDLRPEAGECLELAAVLGLEVEHDDILSIRPDLRIYYDALIARMTVHRLAIPHPSGFSFAHPALRQVLLQRARRSGRHLQHHRGAAAMLSGASDALSQARRGQHLAAAGDFEAAYLDLIAAARYERSAGGIARALVLCDEASSVLDIDDPRTIEVMCTRARILTTARRFEAAHQEAQLALKTAQRFDWKTEIGRASILLGICAFFENHYPTAEELLRVGLELLPAPDAALGLAASHLGWSVVLQGRKEEGLEILRRSAQLYRLVPTQEREIAALLGEADVASFSDDNPAEELSLRKAAALASEPPRMLLQVHILSRQALLEKKRNNLRKARRLCEGMLSTAEGIAAGKTSRLRTLLADICLSQGDLRTAHRHYRACAQPDALAESALERSIIFAGLLASAPPTCPQQELDAWLTQVEEALPGAARHPSLRDLLSLALPGLDAPLRARAERLLSGASP